MERKFTTKRSGGSFSITLTESVAEMEDLEPEKDHVFDLKIDQASAAAIKALYAHSATDEMVADYLRLPPPVWAEFLSSAPKLRLWLKSQKAKGIATLRRVLFQGAFGKRDKDGNVEAPPRPDLAYKALKMYDKGSVDADILALKDGRPDLVDITPAERQSRLDFLTDQRIALRLAERARSIEEQRKKIKKITGGKNAE